MDYVNMLYDEYLKTLNTIPSSEKYLKETFKYWLDEKQRVLPLYEKFLITLDLTPSKGIIEVNKCEKDSILPYTPYETKGFLVSENVKTKKTSKNGIMNINGKVVLIKYNNIDIKVQYQKKLLDVNHIKNYTTHFPVDEETIKLMAELMNTDKNVFIGTYGKYNDKNRMDNFKKLYDLKKELSRYLNKNIEGEVVYTKEFYLAAITPKLKYKEKSK